MKKYLSILVAVMLAAMSFTLTSCGDDDEDEEEPTIVGTSELFVNAKKVSINEFRTNCNITINDSRTYEGYFLCFMGCNFGCNFTYNDIDYSLEVCADALSEKTQDDDTSAFIDQCWKKARTYGWVKVGDVIEIDHVYLYETDRLGAGMRVYGRTGEIVVSAKTKDSITLEFKDFCITDRDSQVDMHGEDEFKFNGKVSYKIVEP